MSRRLTAAELAEPDVTIAIDNDKWASLPADVQKDIRAYSSVYVGNISVTVNGKTKSNNQHTVTMPAYRFRELEARMAAEGIRS